MGEHIISQIRNYKKYVYSQTRWGMLQIFLTLTTCSLSIFVAFFVTFITLFIHREGIMDSLTWGVAIATGILLLIAVAIAIFTWQIVRYWLAQGTQDPMPTKEDITNIIRRENEHMLKELTSEIRKVKVQRYARRNKRY
jgi:uncharacterized membrane protein (DUF485 family)